MYQTTLVKHNATLKIKYTIHIFISRICIYANIQMCNLIDNSMKCHQMKMQFVTRILQCKCCIFTKNKCRRAMKLYDLSNNVLAKSATILVFLNQKVFSALIKCNTKMYSDG